MKRLFHIFYEIIKYKKGTKIIFDNGSTVFTVTKNTLFGWLDVKSEKGMATMSRNPVTGKYEHLRRIK